MSSKIKNIFKATQQNGKAYSQLLTQSSVQLQNLQYTYEVQRYYATESSNDKVSLVVLGSGWASMTLLKKLPTSIKNRYEITVVSPRNYFLYTPLLPAVASGTVEERSIVEPVRNIIHGKGKYYEASCTQVDPARKIIKAEPVKLVGAGERPPFEVPYDILVVGIGTINTTFGIPGIQENCMFFKSIEDANNLRRKISDRFEQASYPMVDEQEKKRFLTFIVVGGGPTGVEVAAEMHDTIQEDGKRAYPSLMQYVEIILVEMMPSLLSMYSKEAQRYTIEQFQKHKIGCMFQSKVNKVSQTHVTVQDKEGSTKDIPYGLCVWATGVAINPLVKQIQDAVGQGGKHFKGIAVNKNLIVRETNGSMFAFGDASTIMPKMAYDYADQLFKQGDVNKDGKLQLGELTNLLNEAASDQEFEHLREHADFLQSRIKNQSNNMGRSLKNTLNREGVQANVPSKILGELTYESELTQDQFKELLKQMDSRISPLPPTAQVAKQEGDYLAKTLNKFLIKGDKDISKDLPQFEYRHSGAGAYIGGDRAVLDVAKKSWTGQSAGWAWKGFETMNQMTFRNSLNVAWDWFRVKVFGRDMSRF